MKVYFKMIKNFVTKNSDIPKANLKTEFKQKPFKIDEKFKKYFQKVPFC